MWAYQPIPASSLLLSSVRALSVTDSLAVGSSEAPSVLVTYSLQDTLSGFDDDWRLLTDSSSFTYHNRIDSLVTRLNGAATGTTEQTVNATDTLSVTLTESASIASSVSSSDTVACLASDAVTSAAVFAVASDSPAVTATDVFTGSQAFSVVDSLASGPTEAISIISAVSCDDSLTAGFNDAITQVAAVISASDSMGVPASEAVQPIAVSIVSDDSLLTAAVDAFTGSQAFSVADALAAQLSEVSTNVISAAVSDSLSSILDDIGTLSQVTISASESLSVAAGEVANVVQNTLLSVSENVVAGFSESATITQALLTGDSVSVGLTDVFTGSQALGVSDDFGFLLSEDQSSSLLVAALDGVATSLSGAASVYLSHDLLDNCTVQLGDVGSKQDVEAAIPKSAVDSCGVSVEEGAVTELAGPYWAGTLGEDRGLVYADSYAMGRRENPGRMRW